MQKTYHLSEEIGIELLARTKAVALSKRIQTESEPTVLDFKDVKFISRSFADELCNLKDSFKDNISFINMEQVVVEMMSAVADSRKRIREKGRNNASFYNFDDVESLSDFLKETC